MNDTLTAVPGVRVGHHTDPLAVTGVTVVVLPEPNVTAVDVRGHAPGTRETALLAPGMKVESVQAICLAGGSAYGLAAADGVVAALERDGRGHPTPGGAVPIVPAAILFDLPLGQPGVRPGPAEGAAAYAASTAEPVAEGSVGAGTGATVAVWRGLEHIRKGGIGSAVRRVGDATVGVLVVTNAAGDVWAVDGTPLTGGDPVPGPPRWQPPVTANTTLAVIATDAALTRSDLQVLMVRAHDAYAVCIRPVHTRYDGDVVFASSCGTVPGDVDALAEAVFDAIASAIERSVRRATALGGVAAIGEETP
jgi:L-aminopeptidase/D-esterase-like protein